MKALSLLIACCCFAASQVHAATPPNMVIIFIGDMGYADIGPFGATKQRTPDLDSMAREGMKLTSFYAAPVYGLKRDLYEGGHHLPSSSNGRV